MADSEENYYQDLRIERVMARKSDSTSEFCGKNHKN